MDVSTNGYRSGIVQQQQQSKPEEKRPEKPHLSATQISMLLRCPRQWYYRYAMGLKIPPSGAMLQSSAWHRSVEANYKHRIATGELLDTEDVVEIFADSFSQSARDETPRLADGEKLHKLKDQGTKIARLHSEQIAPKVEPQRVEEKFLIELCDLSEFDVVGIWDLIEENGTIVDNKALSRVPTADEMQRDVQISMYSLAFRLKFNEHEPCIRFDIVKKTKTPAVKQLTTTRTNGELRWFIKMVKQLSEQVLIGLFPPNPTGWWCSKTHCGYFDRCRGGAAKED